MTATRVPDAHVDEVVDDLVVDVPRTSVDRQGQPWPGAARRPWTPTRTWWTTFVAAAVALSLLVVGLSSVLASERVAGLPQAGAVTDVGLVVSEVVSRVLAVAAVGALVLAAALLQASRPSSPGRADGLGRRASSLGAAASAAWAVLAVVGAAFEVARLTATPVHVLRADVLLAFLVDVPLGRAAAAVAVLASAGAVLAATWSGRRGAAAALVPVVGALAVPQVLSGHSASAPDHVLAVVLLSVHVVVACAWVGGLAAVVLLARRSAVLPDVAGRFSVLALVCFVATGGTGVAAAWVVLGGGGALTGLLGTGYGLLLGAKTVAFVVLGAAGWWHRRSTLPALRRGAPRAFLRFAAAETVLLLLATGLAATLATTSPPPVPATPGADTARASTPGSPRPGPGPTGDAVDAAEPPAAAEDMSGHDHGELTVGVLVDGDRYHVAGPVVAGQRVTVFNGSDRTVTLTARDGSFDVAVASRSLTTFVAPAREGRYPFGSRSADGYADVLVVQRP